MKLTLAPPASLSRRWLAIAAIAAALGAAAAVSALRRPAPTPVTATPAIQQPTGIAASGSLEPAGEAIALAAPPTGEPARVAELKVARGDTVAAGDVVAVLDRRDRLAAAVAEAESRVGVARERLAQVKAGAKQGDVTAQAARVQETRAELEGQLAVQRAAISSLEADRDGQLSAQRAEIGRIAAEVRVSETECQRYESLFGSGAVSASQRDSFCLEADTARQRLTQARADLQRIDSSLSERLSEARANLARTVATAEQQVATERATLAAVAEVRPVDVRVAAAELAEAEAALGRARADLDRAYVRAPQAGQILDIYTRPGELVSDRGIVELGQTEQMVAVAEVYETDVARVRVGQRAVAHADGVAGELHGTVAEIGRRIGTQDVLGTDPVADTDARVVEVRIHLDAADSKRVAGLTNLRVTVTIDASSTPDAGAADNTAEDS